MRFMFQNNNNNTKKVWQVSQNFAILLCYHYIHFWSPRKDDGSPAALVKRAACFSFDHMFKIIHIWQLFSHVSKFHPQHLLLSESFSTGAVYNYSHQQNTHISSVLLRCLGLRERQQLTHYSDPLSTEDSAFQDSAGRDCLNNDACEGVIMCLVKIMIIDETKVYSHPRSSLSRPSNTSVFKLN